MRWVAYLLTLLVLLVFWFTSPSAAVMGALSAMIIVPVLSWSLLWIMRGKLRLELSAPAIAQKGEVIRIAARLTNSSVLPMGRLELTVSVENSITGQHLRKKIPCSELEAWELKSEFCGCLYIRIEKVHLYDLFGLLWVNLRKPKDRRVVIMPETFPVLIQQDFYPAPANDCQDYAPDRKGQDRTETYQVRSYVPGDSLAQIHWKLSSKLDQLMVRDPGCPVDQNLMVFVDRSWADVSPVQADTIMEAAVSICQSLRESAVPFQLVWNEEAIHTQDVAEADQLPEAVSALLKSKAPAQKLPGPDVYLGLYGAAKMSRVIYIGTQIPERLDEFGAQTQLVSLLCADVEDSDGVIGFMPETYREDLAQVSWS